MTFLPAVIVFVVVFLSFSKEVLGTKEEPRKPEKFDRPEINMSDALRRYQLMNELGKKS